MQPPMVTRQQVATIGNRRSGTIGKKIVSRRQNDPALMATLRELQQWQWQNAGE